MSVLDKVVAAVTPEASDEERTKARGKALEIAGGRDWLALVIEQHRQIEAGFAAVKSATSADARRAAQKQLALVLTGHSLAEETVLYPAMALTDQKAHSGAAYTEQSAAKVQIAALDDMDPMSQDYLDKLEHLRAAIAHHVYEEESKWLPKLHETAAGNGKQAHLTQRFQEEFTRYMGSGSSAADKASTASPA